MGTLAMEQLDTFLGTLKHKGNLSANTIDAYAGDLRRFHGYLSSLSSNFSHAGIVTATMIMDFLESEFVSGFSPSTLQRRKMVLAQFAQYLVSIGELKSDEASAIHSWQPKLWQKIYHQDIFVLSEEEVLILLQSPSGTGPIRSFRDLAIMTLLLETGLSISDVLGLCLDQVDLENATVTWDGQRGSIYQIPQSQDSISRYLLEERPEVAQSKEEDVLFISQLGGPISRQGGWQLIKKIGVRAGFSTPLSPRVLRHTSVLRMIDSGLTSQEIQNRLGHTNIYSTRALIRKIKRAAKIRKDAYRNDSISNHGKN